MCTRPVIYTANTASVEFIYSMAGEVNENVIHVRKGSPFSLADLQALRGVCDTWDNTSGKANRNTLCTLYRIRTKALDNGSAPLEDYYLPTPRFGTLSGTVLPLNCALCCKVATASSGRSQRGRWYQGNLAQSAQLDAGHVTAAFQTQIVTSLTLLKTNLASAGYTWVVTSFRNNNAWRTAGNNTDVTQILCLDTAYDSQRRRLPGRGHTI